MVRSWINKTTEGNKQRSLLSKSCVFVDPPIHCSLLLSAARGRRTIKHNWLVTRCRHRRPLASCFNRRTISQSFWWGSSPLFLPRCFCSGAFLPLAVIKCYILICTDATKDRGSTSLTRNGTKRFLHKAPHSHWRLQLTAVRDLDRVQTATVFDIFTARLPRRAKYHFTPHPSCWADHAEHLLSVGMIHLKEFTGF